MKICTVHGENLPSPFFIPVLPCPVFPSLQSIQGLGFNVAYRYHREISGNIIPPDQKTSYQEMNIPRNIPAIYRIVYRYFLIYQEIYPIQNKNTSGYIYREIYAIHQAAGISWYIEKYTTYLLCQNIS